MYLTEGIKDTIDALRGKTVANGATPAEAEQALKMISKLQNRYGIQDLNSNVQSNSEHVQNYYANKDSMSYAKIVSIDWDLVAKELLSRNSYSGYLEDTGGIWSVYNRTVQGLSRKESASMADYRHACYKAFINLL